LRNVDAVQKEWAMPIRRHLPGEVAPGTGSYALVGHYGEPSGVAVWRDGGERLPLVSADLEHPLWFFLVDEIMEVAKVA
jgi:hypothetical protein